MSVPRQGCAAVCIDGNVYVMGGLDGDNELKSAEMYDTSAGQWRALPDMSVPRNGCAAACIEGNVYVMGGWDGDSRGGNFNFLKSAETYDTSAGQWRALPDMSVPRQGCAAVCIEGNLYVAGGVDSLLGESTTHSSVEHYDPVTGQWRTLASMGTGREFCAAVACDM
jgi:N-acetylneuraminic acid mutarotase